MSEKTEGPANFLDRWSRLKEDARARSAQVPAAPAAGEKDAAPPPLPPLESLSLDSDFSAYFHPKVDESLRRAALKKLFGDPHFNVMDGLDVYIDDYSTSDPLPEALLAQLKQAQNILAWSKEDAERRAAQQTGAADGEPHQAIANDRDVPNPSAAITGEAAAKEGVPRNEGQPARAGDAE